MELLRTSLRECLAIRLIVLMVSILKEKQTNNQIPTKRKQRATKQFPNMIFPYFIRNGRLCNLYTEETINIHADDSTFTLKKNMHASMHINKCAHPLSIELL